MVYLQLNFLLCSFVSSITTVSIRELLESLFSSENDGKVIALDRRSIYKCEEFGNINNTTCVHLAEFERV